MDDQNHSIYLIWWMNGILQFETNVYCLFFHFSVFQRLSVFGFGFGIFVGEDLKNWRTALRSVSKSAGVSYIPHVGAEDTGCKTMASTYDVWNACVWYVRV